MDSYMASNGACFMLISTIFQNRLLEVGVTQKIGRLWRSKRSQPLILFYFIVCEDLHEHKFIEIAFS